MRFRFLLSPSDLWEPTLSAGRRDLPGLRTGAVPRENRPLDAFLTRGLQVPASIQETKASSKRMMPLFGAEDGTCPVCGPERWPALTAPGSHSLPALQVPYLDKQKTIHLDGFLFMVRKTGLEPVRSDPHAPQTCASAGSATSACRYRRMILYYIFSALSR